MSTKNTNLNTSGEKADNAYEPPRIVTFSAEELENRIPTVTACESFDPNAAPNEIQKLSPTNPTESF